MKKALIAVIVAVVVGIGAYFLLVAQKPVDKIVNTNKNQTATTGEQNNQPQTTDVSSLTPSITAANQESGNQTVIVQQVTLSQNGYVVIHLNRAGKPDKTIGHSDFLEAGVYTGITIPVSELSSVENPLFAMLHYDDGNGTYEFPGGDGPITADGKPVMASLIVTNIAIPAVVETTATDIIVKNQETSVNEVNIQQVNLEKSGYVVIHLRATPATVIGHSNLLAAGVYTNITVPVDNLNLGDNPLFAMIHFDDGNGTYDFPGADAPAIVNDKVIVKNLDVTKVAESSAKTPETTTQPEQTVKEFSMTAKRFSFDPAKITVNQGDKVSLKISNIDDVPHGFSLPDFNINVTLTPSKTETVEFTADKAGQFTFACSVVCGAGHADMQGLLIVNPAK